MIGYICKYTPVDIIESFGEKAFKITPSVSTFDTAHSLTHSNMCSYSKAIIEECYKNNIDKIILVNCCDSIRRLYDILINQPSFKFVYIIDLPRKFNNLSLKLFKSEIYKFIKALEYNLQRSFSLDDFKRVIKSKSGSPLEFFSNSADKTILLMGARFENYLLDDILKLNYIFLDITCTNYQINYSNIIETTQEENTIENYASSILSQFPCMRMCDTSKRYDFLLKNKDKIMGIIYHTVKFCDYYAFDYATLKKNLELPILKIETDFLLQSKGQIKTRIDAFLESLEGNLESTPLLNNCKLKNSKQYFAGIDSGSTSTNVVIIDENKNIVCYSVVKTGAKSIEGAQKALDEALSKSTLTKENLNYIISTGYGRVNIPFCDGSITEITCHGKGAHHLNNNIRTIIDIGGQDSKVIKLDDNGNVKDFVMNDKCAAGTGRFLENMCKVLDMDIKHMGKESLRWRNDLTITNMCTVFAESEVVSLIAQNEERPDIVHGICKSVSTRVVSLVNRAGGCGEIMMTGGVAKNIGVVKTLEKLLSKKICIPEEPQIVGALGASLFALEKFESNKAHDAK